MFDPPLTQHTDKAILDPWIWTGTIIAMIMFFTMSGLLHRLRTRPPGMLMGL